MKRIAQFLIVLLILAVTAIGCGKQGAPTQGTNPYIGGSSGIESEFEPFGVRDQQTRLYQIFEGESFPVEVTLKNKGEFEIQPGMVKVSLKGINIADFSGITSQGVLSNTQGIDAVDKDNKDGGEITLDFTPGVEDAKYLIPISGSTLDVTVFGEVEYEYKTFAIVPEVCYKEDLKDQRICNPEQVKTVYSSSAPIQVVRAEQKLAGKGKIAIEFQIEDKQHETDFTTVARPTGDFDSRFDILSFRVDPANEWECKSSGKLNEARLDSNGKAIIRCVLINPMPSGTLYTKQLDLILHYRYRKLIQQTVRIEAE